MTLLNTFTCKFGFKSKQMLFVCFVCIILFELMLHYNNRIVLTSNYVNM